MPRARLNITPHLGSETKCTRQSEDKDEKKTTPTNKHSVFCSPFLQVTQNGEETRAAQAIGCWCDTSGMLIETIWKHWAARCRQEFETIQSFHIQTKVQCCEFQGKEKKKRKKKQALSCTIWSVTHPDKTSPPLPANRSLNDKEIMVILKQTALLLSVSNYVCHIVMKHWKWCNLQKYWGALTF